MSFPIEKYKFVINKDARKIIAISTYAGKSVRGIATCSPEDEWNEDYGKRLAAARCNKKVAERRMLRAYKKANACRVALENADLAFNDAMDYWNSAREAYLEATDNLASF